MGIPGFILTLAINTQIYCMLFVLQWCAYSVKVLVTQIQKMREIQAGTYTGFELTEPVPSSQRTNYLSSTAGENEEDSML